jgi:hypothetical protein
VKTLEAIYGIAPIIGYAVSIEDLKTDYALYVNLYKVSNNGQTMTKEQIKRLEELKMIFEPQNG